MTRNERDREEQRQALDAVMAGTGFSRSRNPLSQEQLSDKEVAMKQVKMFGSRLEQLSDVLRSDPDIAWAAVRNRPSVIGKVKGAMSIDKELNIYAASKKTGFIWFNNEVKAEKWFIKEWIKYNPSDWSNSISGSKDVILGIIREADDDYRITFLNNMRPRSPYEWEIDRYKDLFREAIRCTSRERCSEIITGDDFVLKEFIEDHLRQPTRDIHPTANSTDKTKKPRRFIKS